MKKVIALTFLLLAFVPRGDANAAGSITDILNVLIKNNLLHDAYNNDAKLGRAFCKSFNGTYCSSVRNLGQGICSAGGKSSCLWVNNIGQGICSAGSGSYCSSVRNINDGIKEFNKTRVDRDWDWDQFYHSSGSLVWACRGIQTGRFAEKYRCAEKFKSDQRWPNK